MENSTNPIAPERACVDLTLIWGADSYLTSSAQDPADPWRENSFRLLVDVALGAPDVFFPIPENDGDAAARAFGSALNQGARLSSTSYAPAVLPPDTELAVVNGFRALMNNVTARLDLAKWIAYQLSASRFESYAAWTGSKRQPITQDGAETWSKCRGEMLDLAGNLKIAADESDLAARYAITTFASSPREFMLLYAFDGYRRGWQYAEYAGTRDAVYFPHTLRSGCLARKGAAWVTIEDLDGLSFSWSRYFLNLITEVPAYRDCFTIGQFLQRVRMAIEEDHEPRWTHLRIANAMRERPTPETLDAVRSMFAYLNRIATRAELPVLRRKPDASTLAKATTLLGSQLVKLAADDNPFLAPFCWLFEGVTKAVKLIPSAKVWIEKKEHAIPAAVFRGGYGYRGLVPLDSASYEDPMAPRY